jgi:hypothetical protein
MFRPCFAAAREAIFFEDGTEIANQSLLNAEEAVQIYGF